MGDEVVGGGVEVNALRLTQLGSCLSRAATWNPLRANADEVFRYIDLSSVDQDTKSIAEAREIACIEAPSRARQLVSAGDVLVSTVRPNLNGVARVPEEFDGATASTGFCVLRPEPSKIDGSYLFQWVKSSAFVSDMVSKATGASYPAVSDRIIFESSLPLPPLEEQRRIAAILDQAETLRTQRRAALAQLDSLTQSLFVDMFGDPNRNEKGWKVVALESVCDAIWDIDHKMPKSVEEGMPFISAKDLIENGQISFEDIKRISNDDFKHLSKKGLPRKGDIIYSRIGVNLGKARMVEVEFPFLASYSCCTIRPNESEIDRQYLCNLLDSPFLLKQAQSGIRGIAVPDLGMGEIRNFQIVLPPLALQQSFATRIQAIEALKATHRTALAELDALFASLQQRAFAGELTARAPATVAAPPARRSFAELGQLDAIKGVESLVYAAKRLPGKGHYWPTKVQYFADKRHLERYGCTIYGETHVAMPYGPVPQAAFNASRALAEGELISEFPMDLVRAALRREGDHLIALRDAEMAVLSAQERESLEWAIRYVRDMSFDQLKTASHDAAWYKTAANVPMAWRDIIATLAPEVQKRLSEAFA